MYFLFENKSTVMIFFKVELSMRGLGSSHTNFSFFLCACVHRSVLHMRIYPFFSFLKNFFSSKKNNRGDAVFFFHLSIFLSRKQTKKITQSFSPCVPMRMLQRGRLHTIFFPLCSPFYSPIIFFSLLFFSLYLSHTCLHLEMSTRYQIYLTVIE